MLESCDCQIGSVGGRGAGSTGAFSITRFMNRSGVQFAVFHVVGAAAVVAGVLTQLRTLRCPGARIPDRAQTAPLRLPPWFTATAVSLIHREGEEPRPRFAVGALDARSQGTQGPSHCPGRQANLDQQGRFP